MLFRPITIESMRLKNRIVMPPMTATLASADGQVGERFMHVVGDAATASSALEAIATGAAVGREV